MATPQGGLLMEGHPPQYNRKSVLKDSIINPGNQLLTLQDSGKAPELGSELRSILQAGNEVSRKLGASKEGVLLLD